MAKSRWWSRRAVGLHVTAAIVVPGCLVLCWWQITRAVGGNGLSWAYVFEWPLFAGYGVFLWWRLIHEDPTPEGGPKRAVTPAERPAQAAERTTGTTRRPVAPTGPQVALNAATYDPDDPDEQEREAYNRYLAELHARGRRSRW